MIKVENMTSSRSGRPVANQFIITYDDGVIYFQSYNTVIAREWPSGNIDLDKDNWDASMTTSKYRNMFLGEDRQTTMRKIKDGTYKLENLN